MSLDLYERDTEDRLSSMTGVRVPEASMWDGFARGTANTAMLEMAKTARAVSMAGSVGPILYDKITGGTEAQDRYFKRHDEFFGPIIDYWTPNPADVGAAGQIAGQLLGTLPLVFANPSLAVAKTQLSMAEDLVNKGVPADKAQQAAMASAVGLGLGIWVPILGKTLVQRMLLGGAGFNVLQGVATRGATDVLLQGTPAAEDFKAFGGVDLTLDVLMGLAFGGWAHISPGMRAQSAEFWNGMKNWRENLTETQIAALSVMRQAQHATADSLPGMPRDDYATINHVLRLNTAVEQLVRDQPVSVNHLPAANVAPDINRMEASLDRARALSADAFEANVRQQLDSLGRFEPEVNAAYAKLTRDFYESTANRLGITVEAMTGRYGLNIIGRNADGKLAILDQGPRTDWLELKPESFPGERANPLAAFVQREGIRGAQGRLTRALERAGDIGGPDNQRMVFEKDGKRFVIGKLTPKDWIDRVVSNMSADEIKAARAWYGDLHTLMAKFFGEKNAERYALAWLLSQQNESPSGGMRNVLRAADMVRGLPEVKKAGLAQNKLLETLRGELPKEGYDAKLLDFIDSELRRSTRTVMGDDPRGGKPAVIDVWANRDVGKVDDRTLKYIGETFGEDVARHVQIDGTGIGETDYEFGSRFYNRLAEDLNATNFDGGKWLPLEAQAVGWTAMQKQLGAKPEFPRDIFDKNIRRVSVGLAPGAGTRLSGEITPQGAARILTTAAELTGVKIQGLEVGSGSYLGDREGAIQIDVLGSPEGFQDFAAVAGYALKQTEVIITRPMASGKTAGVTLVDLGNGLADPARAEAFMDAVRARLPEGSTIANGYQMVTVDGRPALRAFHGTFNPETGRVDWSGTWKPKELAAFNRAVHEVAQEQGFDLKYHSDKFEVVSEYNDWNARPEGQGFRDSLLSRGRAALEAGLSGNDELRILPNEISSTPERGQVQGVEFFQEPVWYSALQRGLEGIGTKSATADQWIGTIKGLQSKGVKSDEIEFSGLKDWLATREGKVSREEVLDFVRKNGVQVTETTLGTDISSYRDYVYNEAEKRLLSQVEDGDLSDRTMNEILSDLNRGLDQARTENDINDAMLAAGMSQDFVNDAISGAKDNAEGLPQAPRYEGYQLPGGKNYKELLLTLPLKSTDAAIDARGEFNAKMVSKYGGEMWYDAASVADKNEFDKLDRATRKVVDFKSSHYDTPNIIAHVRFNERTDAQGNKVLFIEEIQSDWAQKGKKVGFKGKENIEFADKMPNEHWSVRESQFGGWMADYNGERLSKVDGPFPTRAQAVAHTYGRSVGENLIPSAPFVGKTEAWVALSLKRMIRYAADNGFDRIAWTTGEQQAARYDLSTQVRYVQYADLGNGKYEIEINTEHGQNINRDEQTPADLENLVGKELTKKIVAGEGEKTRTGETRLSGVDLKVGGEGMKAFYDKIVPNVANDVLKKIGGGRVEPMQFGADRKFEIVDALKRPGPDRFRVEEVYPDGARVAYATAPTEPRAQAIADRQNALIAGKQLSDQQPGFDITPQMLEAAKKGMPLFQKGMPETEPARGKISFGPDITKRPAVISLLEGADRSTFLHESGHLYLEIYSDLMAKGRVPDEITQDFNVLMKWLGVKDAEQWKSMSLEEKRPMHEKFARGFETYLAEGRAPRPELNSLFAQFKSWLIDVYQSLTGLGVDLTPDVRQIFDRMLGARPEVEAPRTAQPKRAGAPEPDPLTMEADRVTRENPDLVMHMGTDEQGNPVQVKVSDFLNQERAAAEMAMRDADLFSVAADCLTGAA